MPKDHITWSQFSDIDMRIGTVIHAEIFKEAKNPSYKLKIDFGVLGILKSSAQITELYEVSELIGKQVVAVVNFPPKQIANMMSECLVLGGLGKGKDVVLLQPEQSMENGTKIS